MCLALACAGAGWAGGHSTKGVSWDGAVGAKGVSWDGAVVAKGVSWDRFAANKGVSWDRLIGNKGVSWDRGVSWDPLVRQGFAPTVLKTSAYDPASDPGSAQNVTQMTGATSYWANGYTGQGVGVALIDTGISPVGSLDAAHVINGPDLSFDSQAPNLQYLDGNGHGTFMAGLINEMAPDAKILNVKVANYAGVVDVTQVIAAIDWVVQHRNDNGMNIRVLNLSYGTDSVQPYQIDPLAYAVEQAWKAGITVVTAAGNAGYAVKGSLTNPALDPFVVTAGAADTNGTVSTADDSVASFSSNSLIGPDKRTVDLIAPGTHIVSWRVPGSDIDLNFGSTGYVTDTLFRGSGTSEAAALVSGAAALLLSQYPGLSNDQVKWMLANSADRLKGINPHLQGKGELDLANALGARVPSVNGQGFAWSNGQGSVDASRGSNHIVADNGVVLNGEKDIFGHPFNPQSLAALEANGNSWSGGSWNGNSWSGNSWSGNSWSGNSWSGNSWSGKSWSGNSWSGNSWSGNSWSGNSWSGNSWSGNSWSGNSWSGNSWSSAQWN